MKINNQVSNLSKAWRRGFEVARAASLHSNSTQIGYRLGAALYAGSTLLSVGYNEYGKTTTRSRHKTYDGNVHAEAMSLVRRWHYEKSNNLILYVSRTKTNSERTEYANACSRPCAHCMELIKLSQVRRVRFYDEHGMPAEIKVK